MNKPIVLFNNVYVAAVGCRAVVTGVTNHPNDKPGQSVSNSPEKAVLTSEVKSISYQFNPETEDNDIVEFETLNTIYRRA